MKKLHLANGTIYLKGWTNIDLHIPGLSFLTSERPELVELNATRKSNYYKENVNRKQFMKGEFHDKLIVCDEFGDIRKLDYEFNSVDEILAVQVFEHFGYEEARIVMAHWRSILRSGGTLEIDIPDMAGIMQEFSRAKNNDDIKWVMRQIYGSQKNQFNYHKSGYTKATLQEMYERAGFKDIEILPNIHTYPAFAMKGVKK